MSSPPCRCHGDGCPWAHKHAAGGQDYEFCLLYDQVSTAARHLLTDCSDALNLTRDLERLTRCGALPLLPGESSPVTALNAVLAAPEMMQLVCPIGEVYTHGPASPALAAALEERVRRV